MPLAPQHEIRLIIDVFRTKNRENTGQMGMEGYYTNAIRF